jgi:pSer/pThr/pTyr-binding forkhead associated (FHA) protein
MLRVTLTIKSPSGTRVVPLGPEALTLGRTDASDLSLPDDTGLSRRHATFSLRDESVWVFDEGSTNGSFVGGERVAPDGLALSDGSEVHIGSATTVAVRIENEAAHEPDAHAVNGVVTGAQATTPPPPPKPTATSPSALILASGVAVAALALCLVGLLIYTASRKTHDAADTDAVAQAAAEESSPRRDAAANETANAVTAPTNEVATQVSATPAQSSPPPAANVEPAVAAVTQDFSQPAPEERESPPQQVRLYREMSEEEKSEFVKRRAEHVAIMMGHRPYAFTPEALKQIRYSLDAFAGRAGNGRTGLWRGDTFAIIERGRTYAPTIIRAFREYNVPVVVGLYIPFIETEYNNIASNNSAGAAGLFQFLGPTAEGYGVPAAERTNVDKMSVAAAKYFRDNMMSFGNDPMSVALSIAGYNRAPESVKRDLRNVLNMPSNEDKERSFWTLIANKGVLDEKFQNENVNYVPRFFAAAIFGETPWAFGAKARPLSTYTEPDAAASNAAPTQPTPARR